MSLSFVRKEDGKAIANTDITFKQDEKNVILHTDESGHATLARDIFAFGQSVKSSVVVDGVERGPFDISFDENEDMYQFEYDLKTKSPFWKNFLMALLLLCLSIAAFALFGNLLLMA